MQPRQTAGLYCVVVFLFTATAHRSTAAASDFFESKIRPLLVDRCIKCHEGPKAKSGLDLSTRAGLLQGGDRGPAIVAGRPDESLLIEAVRQTDNLKMPPKDKLTDIEIDLLVRWIREGAIWPSGLSTSAPRPSREELAGSFWSFQPVRRPPLPIVRDASWVRSPVDRFILAELEKRDLRPVAPADKRTLIRRLTFDLIGLPPTAQEIAAFLGDDRSDAFARLADRLLASPRYGERWGRHWMDVVRYADTAGDNADYPIPEIALYRDYIIDALNKDKPFDQFICEQLAGDLLADRGPIEDYASRIAATGFLALSRRYATAPYELWHLTLEDAIETTGRAFIGLTLRCARCHDHKFDPVTTEDYYGLYGIFAATRFPFAGSEELQSKGLPRSDFVPLLASSQSTPMLQAYKQSIEHLTIRIKHVESKGELAQRMAELNKRLEIARRMRDADRTAGRPTVALESQIEKLQKECKELSGRLDAELKAQREQLRQLKRPGAPANLPMAYAVCEGVPTDTPIQIRGDPNQPGRIVPRRAIGFLASGSDLGVAAKSSGRLELARWLTRADHPLTARVMVNRIWQHHFGKGLVDTPSNFGVQGARPTHPHLLDWLANRFVESGWSIKTMHRLMVLSTAYQLASTQVAENTAADPANSWHWRFDRRRLDAESIRDALLAVGGNLELDRPGPHPFPPIADWNWTQHSPFKAVYPTRRRSVYLMTQRIQKHPFLGLFDGPDPNLTTDERTSSTVPLQSLYLMNNSFVREQAEALAHMVLATAGDEATLIAIAIERAWGRPPANEEVRRASAYLKTYRAQLGRLEASGKKVEFESWTSFARLLLTANEFLYVD